MSNPFMQAGVISSPVDSCQSDAVSSRLRAAVGGDTWRCVCLGTSRTCAAVCLPVLSFVLKHKRVIRLPDSLTVTWVKVMLVTNVEQKNTVFVHTFHVTEFLAWWGLLTSTLQPRFICNEANEQGSSHLDEETRFG